MCAICALFNSESWQYLCRFSLELQEAGFILIRAPYFVSRTYGPICRRCLSVTNFSGDLLYNDVIILFRMCQGFIITVLFVQIVILTSLEK